MSKTNINPKHNNPEKLSESICVGLGCSNDATEKITLKAGKFGSIDALVCNKCKNIIKRKEELFSEKASFGHSFSLNPTKDQKPPYTQSTGDWMHV